MKIFLSNIRLFGFHGLYEEEKIIGNWFIVNMEIDYNDLLSYDIKNNSFLNYVSVYELLKKEFEIKEELLENLCLKIVKKTLHQFDIINHCKIQIAKEILSINNFNGMITVQYEQNR